MNHFVEITLVLFWVGYLGLHGWLLRTPAGEADEPLSPAHHPLQGET